MICFKISLFQVYFLLYYTAQVKAISQIPLVTTIFGFLPWASLELILQCQNLAPSPNRWFIEKRGIFFNRKWLMPITKYTLQAMNAADVPYNSWHVNRQDLHNNPRPSRKRWAPLIGLNSFQALTDWSQSVALSCMAALGPSLPFSVVDPSNDSPPFPNFATRLGVLTNLA